MDRRLLFPTRRGIIPMYLKKGAITMENNYNQNNLQQPNTLVFGILGLVLCSAFGIFAVIFGAIGKSKAKKFIAEGGQLAGASKVGYILSKIAFVLGIISLVCYAIIIIACIASPEFRNALLAEYGF